MFLIRSSTRGRGRQGEGEIQFFPPIVPGNRDRKKKISSSPRRKETSFPTIQSDSSRLSRLLSIDRRRNRRGNRTRSSRKHRREKGGEEEREKAERISFDEIESRPFFFCKTSSPPPFPLLLPFSLLRRMETIRFLSGEHPDAIQFRSLTTIVPAFRKSIQSTESCPLPASARYMAHNADRYPPALLLFEKPLFVRGS